MSFETRPMLTSLCRLANMAYEALLHLRNRAVRYVEVRLNSYLYLIVVTDASYVSDGISCPVAR